MRVLFLLFIAVPIVEMWLLITVGKQIGSLPTIGLVLLTAFVGVALLRYQGAMTLLKARMKMHSGELPAREMADGLFFAVGGALLLTPGFVTDAIGFACLIPGVRTWVIGLFSHIVMRSSVSNSYQHYSGQSSSRSDQKTGGGGVIEGDFERHDD